MFHLLLSVSCPAEQEWVYFSGSVYRVSSTKKTWDQSRSDCLQKGADLLVINSREEQVWRLIGAGQEILARTAFSSFFFNGVCLVSKAFANQFKKYMWIGLTDVAKEGSWRWVDGTAMSTRCLQGAVDKWTNFACFLTKVSPPLKVTGIQGSRTAGKEKTAAI